MWLVFALLSTALYSVAEVLDNFLVNKKFDKHPLTLVFFTSLFNFLYVPALFFVERPEMPPLETLPIFILLGFVNIGYLYPYYKGLQKEDTSVTISFLALERIMVPILAFFVVGEVLAPRQYFGIFIIIASVVLLGLHHARSKFTVSKGVSFIAIASLFLALEGVLLKLLFEKGVTVSTAVGGEAGIALLFGLSALLIPSMRRNVRHAAPTFLKLSPLFFVEEIFTFLGLVTEGYAISRVPVSIVKGITMSSPFFILAYAWAGERFFPSIFKENLRRKMIERKIILFLILIVGIMLAGGGQE